MVKKNSLKKARDEVMLNHLKKTINCGPHKSKKDFNRQKEKETLKKELSEE